MTLAELMSLVPGDLLLNTSNGEVRIFLSTDCTNIELYGRDALASGRLADAKKHVGVFHRTLKDFLQEYRIIWTADGRYGA